jgi:hypothetical protein
MTEKRRHPVAGGGAAAPWVVGAEGFAERIWAVVAHRSASSSLGAE